MDLLHLSHLPESQGATVAWGSVVIISRARSSDLLLLYGNPLTALFDPLLRPLETSVNVLPFPFSIFGLDLLLPDFNLLAGGVVTPFPSPLIAVGIESDLATLLGDVFPLPFSVLAQDFPLPLLNFLTI